MIIRLYFAETHEQRLKVSDIFHNLWSEINSYIVYIDFYLYNAILT